MKLYNAIIREVNARLSEAKAYTPGPCWGENADFEMVMLRDAAYELGGDGKPTVNFTCVTTDEALVPGDEIMVIGPDLSELTGSSAETHKEQVRISREALQKGISFRAIGSTFLRRYHRDPNVQSVRLIFITDPKAGYKGLLGLAKDVKSITQSLSKIRKASPPTAMPAP